MKQTTKSLVTVLALVVAAGAIGAVAVWAGKDEEKKAEQKEKSEKVFDFDKSKVRALRLEKGGKLIAALERKDTGPWAVVEPVKTEGDDGAVNALLDSMAGLKQKKDLGDEKDGKPYGLDAPAVAVSVKTDDGKESKLEIGAENPFDKTVYVRRAGDATIRMIDASGKAPFEKELFDLRDKSVAHLDATAEVRRIEVAGTRVPYTLEKDGTAWKLLSPAGAADTATADRISSALKGLKATAIAAESAPAPVAFGLAPAKITVKLGVGQPGGKDTLTRVVSFGEVRAAVTAKTYAKRDDSPVVFEVDPQALKDVDKELFDLQDKQLVHAQREDIRKIALESPGAARIEIARSKPTPADGGFAEEEFSVLAPQKGPAKKAKISSALYSITGLRAVMLAAKDPKKQGLDKPRTLTLLGDGDRVLSKLLVGGETPEHRRYVLADGADKVAEVDKTVIDELPWKLEDALDPPAPAAASPDAGVAAAAGR